MKKLLVILCACTLVYGPASAQCKKLKEKTDTFSGKTERTGHVVIGNLATKWKIDFAQSGDESSMTWGIAMVGEFNQRIEAGTPLLLKLADGSVLKLPTATPSSPVTQVTNGGAGTANIFSVYYLKYNLPKDVLTKLSQAQITDFKIDIPGQEIKNPKIKDSQMEDLQEMFTCLNTK